ncbi:MAG: methylmalonyl Co-A mutase-associated GTPase MeaB, partial [Deltaproteobacteria bacterium]|nr:methylmalonyl Co-A mutase-associated GTPase MeaB [Deltaproteobacteria bacterium]
TVVVLVPEAGDTIQTMKAGLMEIADIFVVNKADREGADRIYAELLMLSDMYSSRWKVPVLKTEATGGKGIGELVRVLSNHAEFMKINPLAHEHAQKILEEECLDIFLSEVHSFLASRFKKGGAYGNTHRDLVSRHVNPYRSASELLSRMQWKK